MFQDSLRGLLFLNIASSLVFLLIGSKGGDRLCHQADNGTSVCYNLVDAVNISIVGFQN